MTTGVANLPVEGPTQDDCARLLAHLRKDYIPALRIEVEFYEVGKAGPGLKLEVIDESAAAVNGKEVVNVWAAKTFGQRIRNFTTADLYDLLMIAYRTIDRYFEYGEASAPVRRSR